MKKLPVIALAMFFAVGPTLALAQGAGGGAGAGNAGGLAQVRQVRLAQVGLGVAQEVGPVAMIPQMQCRRRECPGIEPDSRRAAT